MTKTCSRCREEKTLDNFYRGSASHGRNAYCKPCHLAWQHENKAKPVVVPAEKFCTKCNTTKPVSEFHKSRGHSSKGLATHCKVCHAQYYRDRVQRDPDYFLKFQRATRRKRAAYLNAIKAKGCQDCGESHPACLDFHHRDSATKAGNINRMLGDNKSWESILMEVAKCDVLCSNCHRKRHHNERQVAANQVA